MADQAFGVEGDAPGIPIGMSAIIAVGMMMAGGGAAVAAAAESTARATTAIMTATEAEGVGATRFG